MTQPTEPKTHATDPNNQPTGPDSRSTGQIPIQIPIEPIPAFSDNYIWLLKDGKGAHVVDPGDATPVLGHLEKLGLSLHSVLITHHHFDHVGGLATLKEATGCTVYGPDNPAIAGVDRVLGEGDTVDIGSYRFSIMAVPGHTLDHIAYFQAARGDTPPLLFCGDTLFAGGCGRIFEGDPAMMHRSLQRLAALPDSTHVYCAHEYTLANLAFARAAEPGNAALARREEEARSRRSRGVPTVPSTLELERRTNPFLRSGETSLRIGLQAAGHHAEPVPHGVFAALRAWKDKF